MYELCAVISHKGRLADSGHYVAWVKEAESMYLCSLQLVTPVYADKWLLYDDDRVSYVDNEEIKKLSGKGGGDWHIAYLLLYRSMKVPSS
jgi:ubiquitin carboxyl-terminal hydrolase 14